MKARKIGDLPPFQQPPAPLRRAKNGHENRFAVSYGLPAYAGFFRFTFWKSFKRLSRTRVYEGRVAPHQSERSERAWTIVVWVALAGAAAGQLNGLTPHRSPCRWLGVRLRCAALAVGWRRLRFFGMRGRDRLRPPPPQSNQPLKAENPQLSLGFLGPTFTAFLRLLGSSHRHVSRCAKAWALLPEICF